MEAASKQTQALEATDTHEPPEAPICATGSSSPREYEAARFAVVLRSVLRLVGLPAFVLAPGGEIDEMSEAAHALLSHSKLDVPSELRAAALGRSSRLELELTPLSAQGDLIGWLAIARPERTQADSTRRTTTFAARWSLTTRQTQVLDLVAHGASNARIGATLAISERTAEDHVAAILVKANASTRAELVAQMLG
jgi:DNA-binding NarL/FixJ family response regulator